MSPTHKRRRPPFLRKGCPKSLLSPASIVEKSHTGKGETRAHELTAAVWFTTMKACVASGTPLDKVRVMIRAERGPA